MASAKDLFIASFRIRTGTGLVISDSYWRGVLDCLEHLETFKGDATLLAFRSFPYGDSIEEKNLYYEGIEEGKRLWRINHRQRGENG